MARDEVYRKAEAKIEEARRTGAIELDLSRERKAKDSESLTELPESLGLLTQLLALNASNNQLTALPESLGQLTQLQMLDLASNQLTALPESLGLLTQLQTLNLFNNHLPALPKSLGQLTKLQTLELAGNQLTALPESLGLLTELQPHQSGTRCGIQARPRRSQSVSARQGRSSDHSQRGEADFDRRGGSGKKLLARCAAR